MERITILNRCHPFRGFPYQHAHFIADKKSIEVAVRPRTGSDAVCSRFHLQAPGYDQLAERRFEFIPRWGFLVFLLYTMRRVNCRRCGIVAVAQAHTDQRLHALLSPLGAATLMERDGGSRGEPHLKVIREKCSEALHILDRFHIVAKMNKALDEIRAGESRRMATEGRVPVLQKSRWLLLRREENLKTEQRFRLRHLLRYNLKTVRAYLLKEAFQHLWDYNSPASAGKFLDDWCRQLMRSRIEPMKSIARSLRQDRELILNYFRAQKLLSSGVVEGLNDKAKVTMRRFYGLRTFRCLELALYRSLRKLPEPESTHEFF